jgi:pimeloyl-ACP methyl ester carboxylesterase
VQTKIAHLQQRSTRCLEAGSGRPLVLLHAFPLSADQWLPQLHRVPAGWRYVAPDLRGFRGAGPAFEELTPDTLTIDDYADDVLELMTSLDIDSAAIGGLSMGGYVALSIVARAPGRVAGLILANTRAGADSPEGRAGRDAAIAALRAEGTPAIASAMLPKLLGATTKRDQPDLADAVARMIGHNAPEPLAAALAALRDRPDRTPILGGIRCPTAIVTGAEDAVIPLAEAQAMQRAIPGARLTVLPHAGHLSNLEDRRGFDAALNALLAEL